MDVNATAAGAMQRVTEAQNQQLTKKLGQGYDNADPEELMEACKSFESYFMEQVMKEVGKTTTLFGEKSGDSYAAQLTDYFKDSAYQKVAEQVTEQSGGVLAKQLYEQMKRNYGIMDEEDIKKAEARAQSTATTTSVDEEL